MEGAGEVRFHVQSAVGGLMNECSSCEVPCKVRNGKSVGEVIRITFSLLMSPRFRGVEPDELQIALGLGS